MSALERLFYMGGFELPTRQARAVQSLHTAHALARQGTRVILAVGRAPRRRLDAILADYGLAPHPALTILPLPALRLPRLPNDALVYGRLAAWNWSYGLAALLALWRQRPRARPRLVLARDPRLAWLFLRTRSLTGIEVVYEVHELFATRAREPVPHTGAAPPIRTPRVRRLEERVFREALAFITLTEACKRLLSEEFGVDPRRVLVAPDGTAEVPSALPPRPPDGREIVYAGQLYPWKGVGTLVRALALLPAARLRIIGGAEEDSDAVALRQLAAEVGVLERIQFTGFLPHARVRAAIAGAAAAAVPLPDNPMARFFTSPLKLFEYMAAGVPIVASDLPSLREVLRHEENALLVPPEDPAALAAALARLLAEPSLAERLRARALADAAAYTWSARAARISAFLAPRDPHPASAAASARGGDARRDL